MTTKITLGALSPPSVVIKVHECDTLVFSFPIWLICHSAGIPVRLQTEPPYKLLHIEHCNMSSQSAK